MNITTNQTTQLEILKLLWDLQSNIRGTNTEGSGDSAGQGARGRVNRNENGGRGKKSKKTKQKDSR